LAREVAVVGGRGGIGEGQAQQVAGPHSPVSIAEYFKIEVVNTFDCFRLSFFHFRSEETPSASDFPR
jgi:hypothetical protein